MSKIMKTNNYMGDSQDTFSALHTSIRGLPKARRIRTLEGDLQPFSHGLNTAWRLAQDRGRWRQLVEMAMLQSGAARDDDDDDDEWLKS